MFLACADLNSSSVGHGVEAALEEPTEVDAVQSETRLPIAADERRAWTVAVYIAGDNDLETYVMNDLDELERGGSSDDVYVVAQADRSPDYAVGDGDWTGTRRYEIEADGVDGVVKSPVVEDLGELDTGDAATLADFILWVDANYPSDHLALVLWDHGSGWDIAVNGAIASDDTSGSSISVARGELDAALAAHTAAVGPIDVIAFDACNMSAWEVGHVLRSHALTMTASASTVGGAGLQYDLAIPELLANPSMDAAGFADALAYSAAGAGLEVTFSAVDLAEMDDLAVAIDAVAVLALADPASNAAVRFAANQTGGLDGAYEDWWLDLGDLAANLSLDPKPSLAAAGDDLTVALDEAILANYTNGPMAFASGLSIFGDPWYNSKYTRLYGRGEGATWAEATHWDELLAVWAR